MGVVECGARLEVVVSLSDHLAPAVMVRDKFLVMGAPSETDLSSEEITQLFKVFSGELVIYYYLFNEEYIA